MNKVLEIENVSKAFGGIHALQACSLNVAEGSISGLIGPNGSGKTTLFNIMTGYERADTGEILFQGKHITRFTPDKVFRQGIGRTFQLTRIFARLTVEENVHIAAQRNGLLALLSPWSYSSERQHALDLLEFVGLTGHRHELAGSLSYGQKKLLEFALILIANPRVILLDEPAGGINPTMINYLAERIRELHRRGITFLIVEHNMEFVMNICDTITVLHRGTAIASGTPTEIRNNTAVLDAYLGGAVE